MNITFGKLFNFKTAVDPDRDHIVTRLKVTNRGVVKEITSNPNDVWTDRASFEHNSFSFWRVHGLLINKVTNLAAIETNIIEAWCKDIYLGKLTLK